MEHSFGIWDALVAAIVVCAVCMLPFWARNRALRLARQENARRNRVCQDWMDTSADRQHEPQA